METVPAVHLPVLESRRNRAKAIAQAGGLKAALESGALPARADVTLSEGLVLGLLKQGVRKYLVLFGHGSTDLGEVLRVYDEAGLTRTFNFRHETAMAHAATALKWAHGETAAVVTSIGPGALQALAGSLAAASNGVGVYHIYGDETTRGEGYNMQQIPKQEQDLFGRLTAVMGTSYVLHTPQALRDALRRGSLTVNHPYKAGPFYLLLPMNIQPEIVPGLNLAALPYPVKVPRTAIADLEALAEAVTLLKKYRRVVIKAGGGARNYPDKIRELASAAGAVVALSPGALGVLADEDPKNMHVGGSKGSLSGNYAMSQADLLLAVGSRAVCQADCSGLGYENTQAVINLNGDLADAFHYNRTVALTGDIGAVIDQLIAALKSAGPLAPDPVWLKECAGKKAEWLKLRAERAACPPLFDPAWGKEVLTQPAAIAVAADFARSVNALKFFDAGDVQANGFQMVADSRPFQTITETGASYMGFSVSALLAEALADQPRYAIAFAGDGSFMMNPQVLIDAVEHKTRGTIVIFDNRRMSAISGLQTAQYGFDFRTHDSVAVDYVTMASSVRGVLALSGGSTRESLTAAFKEAYKHDSLSVVHVPVYYGPDPRGGMGAYGSWNVGNWVADVQARYNAQTL
ncbi:MAG: thiamine pyrophosphate-dependent enzyme [Deltaproteobacteria bacterium]|nr:thiamine pyrophosphate-dependent enzyme [Deltaproteobacteria bacterium]